MERPFRIEGAIFLFAAAALLILPPDWLAASFLGVLIHELCHYLSLRLLRIPVYEIKLTISGCEMRTAPMRSWEEAMCAAAGPAGSLCLVVLYRIFPLLAICGLIQGLYNLLPMYPLDGGRILRAFAGERMSRIISGIVGISICIGAVLISLRLNMGAVLPIFACLIGGRGQIRKISCKEG